VQRLKEEKKKGKKGGSFDHGLRQALLVQKRGTMPPLGRKKKSVVTGQNSVNAPAGGSREERKKLECDGEAKSTGKRRVAA